MNNSILLVSALLAIVVTGTAVFAAVPAGRENSDELNVLLKPGTRSLYFLGTVDGKSYFRDNSSYNWNNAKLACTNAGTKLATINSASQHAFLVSKCSILGNSVHWTGGRDALSEKQFIWDGTGQTLVKYGSNMVGAVIRTAVGFHCNSATDIHYHSEVISTLLYVLCEG